MTTQQGNNTRDYLDDLGDKGWNAGYDHANFALAYAPECLYDTPQRPSGLSDPEMAYWTAGYEDGRNNYIDQQYDDYGYYDMEFESEGN